MASCKANQLEPWTYTRAMINAMIEQRSRPNLQRTSLTSLLPDAWLTANPETHRPWSR